MLLTVEQAAERLGTSVRFIRRLRTERRISVIKLGKHIRIDSTDLDAYIRAGREDALDASSQRGPQMAEQRTGRLRTDGVVAMDRAEVLRQVAEERLDRAVARAGLGRDMS